MPNIKSQIKRLRQSERRRLRNKAVKSEVKTYIKKFEAAVQSGDVKAAEEALKVVQKKIDKGRSKGVFHKNTAARKVAKLAQKLYQLKVSQQQTA